jgi:hypothetical protein
VSGWGANASGYLMWAARRGGCAHHSRGRGAGAGGAGGLGLVKKAIFLAGGIDWHGILCYICTDKRSELACSAKPWGIFDWFGLKGCGFHGSR